MIAIIIPYYKRTFFEATLQSLAGQTDKRFKVYIGDDASPENPNGLLEKYQEKFDFTYHRFESNLGGKSLVKQWERCVVLTGDEEWVMILGDDDVLGENVVKEFYSNFNEISKTSDVVRFSSRKIDEEGKVVSDIYRHPKTETSIDFLFRNKRNSLSEYVFNKNQIKKIGFRDFPLAWCSDILAVLEFSNFGMVYTINEAVVNVRISLLSVSGSSDNINLKYLASEQFSHYIIFQKFHFFNKDQRLSILYGYETAIKRNKKIVIRDWVILFRFYILNFKTIPFLKFLRRFFMSTLKLASH